MTTLVADEVTVHNCGYGVVAGGGGHSGTAEAYLTRVTITGAASGAVLADSSVGFGTALVSVANSTLSGNAQGVTVGGSSAKLVVATSVIVRNKSEGMYNISRTLQSRGDNTVHDNNGGGVQTFGTIGSLTPI